MTQELNTPTGDLLLGWRLIVQSNAGHALKFSHRAFQHHRPAPAHSGWIEPSQVQHGLNACFLELGCDLAPYSPNLSHFGRFQHRIQFFTGQLREVADLGQFCRVGAGFALSRLGHIVGQLGQGLGWRNTDTAGNPHPLQHPRTDDMGSFGHVPRDAAEVHEALINRIHLMAVPQRSHQAGHAVRHVAIQRKVGREGHKTSFFLQMPDLMPGMAHAHPQGLGLVRSGNGAAVVVAQDDHRPMLEVRPEHPFTADVEIVAIHQRVQSDLQPVLQSECSGCGSSRVVEPGVTWFRY
jgi:hypothetical protein